MFLRNGWYVAALTREVGPAPLSRWIAGEPLVLFRTEDGTAVALSDRCPHRGAQLSLGRVVGDALVCGYHGFAFDAAGRCTQIPGLDRVPEQIAVRQFPLVEKWNWLFVWMGDPARAAETPLPDFHWLTDPDWAGSDDLLEVAANYTLLRDNLLDLSHAKFVHTKTLATDAVTEYPVRVVSEDGVVRVTRDMRDIEPSPFFKRLAGFAGRVDHHQTIEFTPPCHVVIKVRVAAVAGSGENKVVGMRVLNALVPADDRSSHYFWALMRDFALEDAAATALQHRLNHETFLEDVTVIEAQQKMLQWNSADWKPLSVPADRGCVLAERVMMRLMKAEEPAAAGAS